MNYIKQNKLPIFLLIALTIPCSSIVGIHIFAESNVLYYMLIALFFIFVINPILIIISLCLIKKYPKLPQAIICTTSINFLFWIILLLPASNMHIKHKKKLEQNFLQSYEHTITDIYEYKKENNKFPDRIEQIKSFDKTLKNYFYEKTNQDFVLTLKYTNVIQYKYCSDSSSGSCALFKTDSFESTRVGKWTKIEEID